MFKNNPAIHQKSHSKINFSKKKFKIKKYKPAKTKPAPIHCWPVNLFPKNKTENNTVTHFLVVVMILVGKGPFSEMHMKIKCWKKGKISLFSRKIHNFSQKKLREIVKLPVQETWQCKRMPIAIKYQDVLTRNWQIPKVHQWSIVSRPTSKSSTCSCWSSCVRI